MIMIVVTRIDAEKIYILGTVLSVAPDHAGWVARAQVHGRRRGRSVPSCIGFRLAWSDGASFPAEKYIVHHSVDQGWLSGTITQVGAPNQRTSTVAPPGGCPR